MGLSSLLNYLLGAAGYALFFSGLVFICGRGLGLRWGWGQAALVLSTAFVVFLALSPFPDPAQLDCSNGGVALQLTPFAFLDAPMRLWDAGAPLKAWLRDLTITSTIMNVIFFALVGAALATQTLRFSAFLLYGMALTSSVELTQFTGLYGFYPCRYRTVDVDDVMMNIVGVVLGALLVRGLRARHLHIR